MTRGWPVGDERGFVMVMVILLLFTVAVAGATGYQLVALEAELAGGAEESQAALAAARAGLERFVGEHIGVPDDTTMYVIGGADVAVVARRIVGNDTVATPDLYLLKALAELADPQHPDAPARRTVQQYARLHKRPVNVIAALMTGTGTVTTNDTIRGFDAAASGSRGQLLDKWTGDCGGGNPAPDVHGLVALSIAGPGSVQPAGVVPRWQVASAAAAVDTAGVRWSALQDPSFPVPFTGSWPDFGALPADSFPVVRMTGDLIVGPGTVISGRGVLIVPGTFAAVGPGASFDWDGLVLAGAAQTPMVSLFATMRIDGALVVGLDGGAQGDLTTKGPLGLRSRVYHNSCYVAQANRVLAYFELVDGTRWEL
jgi:hypothetical protein